MPAVNWINRFEKSAEPEHWEYTARTLLLSADLLWTEMNRPLVEIAHLSIDSPEAELLHGAIVENGKYGMPALLLGGYAIENILKATLLRRWQRKKQPAIVSGKLDRYFGSHHLLTYARDVGLALSPLEEMLIKRLEQCVVWAGKYPVDKKAADRDGSTNHLGPYRVATSNDQTEVRQLFDRLSAFFDGV